MIAGLPYARRFGNSPRPPRVPRLPLPPAPPGEYDRTLPFVPPPGPDRLFYRGNFSGVRVPGIPILPEMSGYTVPGWKDNKVGGLNPCIMSLDITRYWNVSRDLVIANLNPHAERGYTHLQCSIGHAIEQGLTIDQYVEYAGLVKQIVGFADHWFLGGGPFSAQDKFGNWTEARDQDRNYWAAKLDPWINALLSNGLTDAACVGWQLDGGNTGTLRNIDGYASPYSPIQSIVDYFADRLGPHDIPIGTHWRNEAGGWWDGDDPEYKGHSDARFVWWRKQRNKVYWFHHQGSTRISIPDYQAKLVDTLQPFGDGRMGTSGLFGDRPFSLTVYECSGQDQFDMVDGSGNPSPYYLTEDQGDQRGMYLCCTKAASHVGGYGNGGRLIDGALL